MPRARIVEEDGRASEWRSRALPRYQRLTRKAEALNQVEAGGLVPVEDVIERLEGARPDKVGKRQLIGVADALARLGVGMAPDPRFALRQPRYGEPVVLFHLPRGTLTIETPSEAYRGAILSLAVGTLVAHADGRIDDSERKHMAAQK